MAYCYECGSQVAEIDVFCPYCGISLKPAGVGDGGDSMDKTIVITNGESSNLPGEAVSGNVSTPEMNQTAEPQTEPAKVTEEDADTFNEFGKSTADFSESKTGEKFDLKTESIEIPADVFENQIAQPLDISAEGTVSENVEFRAPETVKESESQPEEFQQIEPQVEEVEKIEAQTEQENYADLPEPKHIEILKPIQESVETEQIDSVEDKVQEEKIEAAAPEIVSSPDISEAVSESEIAVSESEIENPSESNLIAQFDSPLVEDEPETEVQETEIPETVAEMSADETSQTEESKEVIEPVAETPAEIPIEELPAEQASSAEVAEVKDFPNQDDVQTMVHPSQELQSELPDSGINLSVPEAEKSEVSESPAAEKIAVEVPQIFKPEIELEEPETPDSAAVFDSVQIVQTEKPEAGFEEKVAAIEAENVSSGEISENAENKEGRSYTTPNIGVENTDGKKAAKLKPLDEGTVLNNRYEIVRKIGGGGMGAVYLASDKNLGGVLRAVKEMVQSYIEEVQQDKAISDFKRESMLLTSLEHTAIPTIYDYFFDDKEARFYLVMKYISGGDLAGRLRAASEGKINEQSVTEWGIQIADVLDYLHNRQPPIVYRDLKPANIMIDGNTGRLMLIDFGIARWINKEEKGVTAVGTMGYAPPELFSGNVEPRSDIYSLGSTMFHLLTGADPQSNPLLIFDFQKNPRPRQINSLLSDQMERILMQAVEYSAEKRFASAAEFRKTLEEHLENMKAGRITYGVKETPASQTLSEQLVFCGFCGQKIVASDMFCAFCGAKQPLAQPGVHASPYAAQAAKAKLTLLNTEEFDAPVFSLEKESNIVGRRDPLSNIFPEVDLSKFDPQTKISRRHARIWREGDNFMVEDLGSSNGTVLQPALSENVRLLPHQPHVLTNGDKIKVGDTTMSFILG